MAGMVDVAEKNRAGYAKPGLLAAVAAEWTKLRALRSTWLTLLIAAVAGIGFSALLALAIGSGAEMSEQQRADIDPAGGAVAGMTFAVVLFIVLGVNAAAPEFSSRMIGVTLTVTPRRGRLVAAKAIVLGLLTLVAGALCAVVSFFVGGAVLSGHGVTMPGLGEPLVLGVLVGWTAQLVTFALLGLAVALLLRSAAGAIALLLALLFLPVMFGGMLPDWVSEGVIRFLPGSIAENLTTAEPDPDSLTYLPPGVAGLLLVAWVVLLLAAARGALSARDAR
ncbi:ABC transporter permease [Amycolatopsis cihanbeyliensis]|uniref:ABC-type transport system involved in multi-copper enzyme maturation permease subunit n=1 Tax=Amycolatopsis cihanbeyliensis TaxID=1128664 RepID=A0A542CTB2_AMYCI|nr:ABC transporter permease [Amycolatopsis cihanbeyliensis]TQI94055.1 ABC-type transport system involved in multi-copper enzyme maturation permease subunit [Amycolatopsis cihanbeyliensis]